MKKDIEKIIDFYGLENQLEQTIEECAELIQAITKANREKADGRLTMPAIVNLVEEMADVQIMLDQLIYFLNCESWVNEIRRAKIERQLKRMAESEGCR